MRRSRTGIWALSAGVLAAAGMLAAAAGAGYGATSGSASVEAREHLRRGLELSRQGLAEAAVAEFQKYLAVVPNDANAHYQLGRALLDVAVKKNAPLSGAVSEIEEALRLDPDRDVFRVQLGEIYSWRKPGIFHPEKMVELFEKTIAAHPERYDIRLRFAQLLLRAEVRLSIDGDPTRTLQDSAWTMDLARLHLEKAIDTAPRESDIAIESRTLLGEVQFRMGEWDAAKGTFEYLLTAFPDRKLNLAPAWNSLGHCEYRKKNYKAAAEAFTRAYDLNPIIQYQYDLKMAYDGLGGYPKDLPERYRFVLRPEDDDPQARAGLKFTDIAPKLHINKYSGAGPCGWADYNGDDRLDLVACGCDTFCSLYRATEDGFVDATIEAGLTRTQPGFGAAWADYDNDGDPDLYIARNGWNGRAPNSLLRNNGDGTFTDVAAKAGVDDPGSGFFAGWFDYDRDGWLDLIVSNGVYVDGSTNQLFHNNGDGTFTNVTRKAGLEEKPYYGTIGVALGDYDDDGWPDIFYHGRLTASRLYHNNHDGTFTDLARAAGVAGPGTQNGYIAFFADFDDDGDLDIITGSLAPWEQVLEGYKASYRTGPMDNIPRFYRNNGDGTFSDSSLTVGLRYPLGVMAGGVGDVDNDGYQDVLFATGDPELRRLEPNIFYHNRRGEKFEDMTRYTGLGALGKGHGVIFQDWDGDGDLDFYAELGGFFHGDLWESAFYLNERGNRNNWLSVRLRQPKLNRDAIGARVTLVAGGMRQAQEVTAGRGFGSTDPPILHFGLGKATKVDRLEVRWPDGTEEVIRNPKTNRTLTLERKEPAGPEGTPDHP